MKLLYAKVRKGLPDYQFVLSHALVGSSGTATSIRDPHFSICQVPANQFRNAISDICQRIRTLALAQAESGSSGGGS
jgi:hypothetical protein